MTTNLEAYVGLLIQIPLVGIFVWFSIMLINTFLKHLTDMRTSYLKNLEDQTIQWRAFLEQERKANHDAIAHMATRFAEEIHILGKTIESINNGR